MKVSSHKSFSFYDATAVIIGIVIGAGIFKLPVLVAMNTGSAGMMFLCWIIGGAVSLAGALCYAELATKYPDEGGDYHFLFKAYGRKVSFLFGYARMMIIQPGSIVMMVFIAGGELTHFISFGKYSGSVFAMIIVTFLTFINIAGVRQFNAAQKTLTMLVLTGLAVIALSPHVLPFHAKEIVFVSEATSMKGFGMALVFVLLTFGGWNEAAYISSEIKDPEKNIVRSLVAGIAVITAVYLSVNFALFYVLGLSGMRSFDAFRNLTGAVFGHQYAFVVSIMIFLAALSTANATIITGGRSNYALGRDFSVFNRLGAWNSKRETPVTALLIQWLISVALIIFGTFYKSGLEAAVDYTAPAFWFFFLLSGASLFVLRKKEIAKPDGFNVPLYPFIPFFFVMFSGFMLINSLIYTGSGAVLSVAVIITGAVFIVLKKI